MKKRNYYKLLVILVITILLGLIVMGIFSFFKPKPMGKIAAPIEAKPVSYFGVKYTAPVNDMGLVIAFDEKTGIKLWEKKIYEIKINPLLEEDVQWVFIKELKIEGHKLIITNTNYESYSIDVYGQAIPPIVTKIR